MRVWQRSSLQLAAIVPFEDWVFSLASRGGHVLAGLSRKFHVLDQCTLQPLRCVLHQVSCYRVAWLPLHIAIARLSDSISPRSAPQALHTAPAAN